MRRYRLHAAGLILMWIGGIFTAAGFLTKFWFQFNIQFTPYFFLLLLVGAALYIASRVL